MKNLKIYLFIFIAFFLAGVSSVYALEVTGSATVTVIPAPTVTISASPTTVNAGSSSTITYSSTGNVSYCTLSHNGIDNTGGASRSVTETINSTTTYSVVCVGAGGTSSPASVTINVNAPIKYTVSTNAGANGSISPTSASVNANSTTSFTISPNSGYSIASTSGCGGSLSGSTYTTAPITSNCTVSATFTSSTSAGTCGALSGTYQPSEPTGTNACSSGTLNSTSPANTVNNWNWSCGTTTCSAIKYGCNVSTDTNYDASGANNNWNCSNVCANGMTNYPTCTTIVSAGTCGALSGTYQPSEPTGTNACSSGTLNSTSPANTVNNWNWSCGTTTCSAIKYGCNVSTDTNYDASGANNNWNCSNVCANGMTNYPTCTTIVSAGTCGALSGTYQPSEPTGTNACSSGTLNSTSPANTVNNWNWSCGTTTCSAIKYGCNVSTDTNYDASGANNNWNCSNVCANGSSDYPACPAGPTPVDGYWSGDWSYDMSSCPATATRTMYCYYPDPANKGAMCVNPNTGVSADSMTETVSVSNCPTLDSMSVTYKGEDVTKLTNTYKKVPYNGIVKVSWQSSNSSSCKCTAADTKTSISCGNSLDMITPYLSPGLKRNTSYTVMCSGNYGSTISRTITAPVDIIRTDVKEQ